MILTDGIDTFTYTGPQQLDDFLKNEQSTSRTVGGNLRTVSAGKRYTETLTIRLKASEKAALFALLNKPSGQLSYTPTVIPGYLDSTYFPMPVNIDVPQKSGQAGGNGKTYFITLSITSVGYL